MLWEKEIARRSFSSASPVLIVAGSRWQGMAARHGSLGCQEMAIITGTPWLCVPLSSLRKVPLYVTFSSKVCACVVCLGVFAEGRIEAPLAFLIRSS